MDLGRAAPLCVPGGGKRAAAADAVDTLSPTHLRTASEIIAPASRYQCSSRESALSVLIMLFQCAVSHVAGAVIHAYVTASSAREKKKQGEVSAC